MTALCKASTYSSSHGSSELLDKIYSTDPTKARQCSAMSARVSAFVTKADLCHDIYSRYVNPIVTQAYYSVCGSDARTQTNPANVSA